MSMMTPPNGNICGIHLSSVNPEWLSKQSRPGWFETPSHSLWRDCDVTWLTSHYNGVIMSALASQITSITIVYSTVYSWHRSKKTSKLRVTGLCAGNSPVTGDFPAQRDSDAKNVSIWWRHHDFSGPTYWDTGIYECRTTMVNVPDYLTESAKSTTRADIRIIRKT